MNRIKTLNALLTAGTPEQTTGTNPVTVTIEGLNKEIGVVTMANQSNLNALDTNMRNGLGNAIRKLDSDPKIKVICLRSGIEKVFCAGANIKDMEHKQFSDWLVLDDFNDASAALANCKKPIIAAIHKIAYGGGFEIALLCDIILAAEDTKIGLPEIKLGLMPGIGGTLVSKYIGKGPAMKMILTGEPITAQQAHAWGLVTEVHKADQLHAKQLELAEKVAQHSVYSLIHAKLATKFSFDNPSSQAAEFERRVFYSDFALPGAKEGISAFIAKKKPDFRGK